MELNDRYPGLDYKASELSAYGVAMDTFVLSLKNKELVRFTPGDAGKFRNWLNAHKIRDVNDMSNTQEPTTTKTEQTPKPKRKWF